MPCCITTSAQRYQLPISTHWGPYQCLALVQRSVCLTPLYREDDSRTHTSPFQSSFSCSLTTSSTTWLVLRWAEGKTFLLLTSHKVSRFWTKWCNKWNSYAHLLARLKLRVLKARLFCAETVDIWKSLNIKIYSVETENNTYLTHDISLAFIQLESISS